MSIGTGSSSKADTFLHRRTPRRSRWRSPTRATTRTIRSAILQHTRNLTLAAKSIGDVTAAVPPPHDRLPDLLRAFPPGFLNPADDGENESDDQRDRSHPDEIDVRLDACFDDESLCFAILR